MEEKEKFKMTTMFLDWRNEWHYELRTWEKNADVQARECIQFQTLSSNVGHAEERFSDNRKNCVPALAEFLNGPYFSHLNSSEFGMFSNKCDQLML